MNASAKPAPPNLYHLHLDICEHCRDNPGNECANGKALLKFSCSGDLKDLEVADEPVAFDRAYALMTGQSIEDVRKMKVIGRQVFGPWGRFL